jgi:rhombotail lipoprotein
LTPLIYYLKTLIGGTGMGNFMRNIIVILATASVFVALTGCGYYFKQQRHHNSSVFQYLYPDREGYIETPGIPRLALPLKVGIAFVPEETGPAGQTLTEKDKMELMAEVSSYFKKYDFVKSIEIIPSAYLVQKGSFANLYQIRTMYGVDVITLVSYDQMQFTDEGIASISYWTIVGAYIVPGEKNDTHTMVDASVYDIQSRKMLFRAPGVSHIKSKATLVNLSEQLRGDSLQGFKDASKDLIVNLEMQLELFKEKVKESPADYQVVYNPGYTGGGSIDSSFIMFLCILCGYWVWMTRRGKA